MTNMRANLPDEKINKDKTHTQKKYPVFSLD